MRGRRPGGPPTRCRPLARLLLAGLLLAAPGCSAGGGSGPAGTGAQPRGTVTVFAAASLTEVFASIATGVEQANPGLSVRLSFGGSSALAAQVVQGAPADVLAAASTAAMTTVTATGLAGPPTVFARNSLQIAVPLGNPAGVTGLADFADPRRKIALCAPEVPCGAAAAAALSAAGVVARPDTLEPDVKAALTRVSLGEVDAALVYRTDVLAAASSVQGIDLPLGVAAAQDYPLAVLAAAPNPAGARAFVDYVQGPGRDVLAAAGFLLP